MIAAKVNIVENRVPATIAALHDSPCPVAGFEGPVRHGDRSSICGCDAVEGDRRSEVAQAACCGDVPINPVAEHRHPNLMSFPLQHAAPVPPIPQENEVSDAA